MDKGHTYQPYFLQILNFPNDFQPSKNGFKLTGN